MIPYYEDLPTVYPQVIIGEYQGVVSCGLLTMIREVIMFLSWSFNE